MKRYRLASSARIRGAAVWLLLVPAALDGPVTEARVASAQSAPAGSIDDGSGPDASGRDVDVTNQPGPDASAPAEDVSGDAAAGTQPPAFERKPFDRITLDAANDHAVLEIFPLESDATPGKNRRVRIRRLNDPPERVYEVASVHIERYEPYPEIVLAEARQRIDNGRFDAAFPYLELLVEEYPQTPGLNEALDDFQIGDAAALFRQRRYEEALWELDEVHQRSPGRGGLDRALRVVLDRLLAIRAEQAQFAEVRRLLQLASTRYGAVTQELIDRWSRRLSRRASEWQRQARQDFEAGRFREALLASRAMLEVWPDLTGGLELQREILRRYPQAVVGVTQRLGNAQDFDPWLVCWPRRRSQPLLRRRFTTLAEFTEEGSRYVSPLGVFTTGSDGRSLALRLAADDGNPTAFQLGRQLLRMADPKSELCDRTWSESLSSLQVPSVYELEVTLSRRHLRPVAILPGDLPGRPDRDPAWQEALAGPCQRLDGPEGEDRYLLASAAEGPPGGEVVEKFFSRGSQAADALLRGQIDVLDRVFPADERRLQADPAIQLTPYRVPSLHFLTFNPRQSLLEDATFRRALCYALDRQGILQQQLLAQASSAGSRVISAPIPIGLSDDDPVGYGYDLRLGPLDYDPVLARILIGLARMQSARAAAPSVPASAADTRARSGPLSEFVLAYPQGDISRVAAQAISRGLARVGIICDPRELPAGSSLPEDEQWDLLYIDAVVQEPLTDVPRLLLDEILGRCVSAHLRQAIDRLKHSRTWDQARERLHRIHEIVRQEVPVIPLWQIADHVAFHQRLQGIPARPVSLYQHVEQWKIVP
jgi:hypothetical protein